jgi:Na+/melibiose symporter-like transporter
MVEIIYQGPGWRYGYQPNVALSDSAKEGILLMMSLIPAAGLLLLAAVFSRNANVSN